MSTTRRLDRSKAGPEARPGLLSRGICVAFGGLITLAGSRVLWAAEAEHEGGLPHAGSWLDWLSTEHIIPAWMPREFPWAVFVIGLVSLLAYLATRGRERVPRGLQNLAEMIVLWLDRFCEDNIGHGGAQWAPFIGALFLYIAAMNLLGLVPGFAAPTANLNTTLALGLIVFIVVQINGFRQSGWRYLLHFIGEPWWLFPLMLPLHVISEIIRPVTLALRLYGNIFGKELAIVSIASLPIFLAIALWPMELGLMGLGLLLGIVQALIFALLASVYLALSMPEHDESH